MSKSRNEKTRTPAQQAPPPVSNDVVSGRFTESDWHRMVDEEEHEEVVVDILGEIIESALDVVYDRYIQSRLVPYTVQTARDLIIQTIEWEFLACDSGEENPAVDSTWLEEEEPCPPITDSWAQGSVPVKIPRPLSVPLSIPELEGDDSGLDSIEKDINRPGRPSPPNDSSDNDELSPTTPESISSPSLKPPYDNNTIKEETDAAQPQPPETKPPQKRRSHYKPHLGKLPDFNSIEISNEDDHNTSENYNNSLEFFSSNSMLKSPHGRPPGAKDVTYDEKGNITGMMKINPHKLPSHRVRTKFHVVDPVSEAAALAHIKAKKKGQYKLLKKGKSQTVTDGKLSARKTGSYSIQAQTQNKDPASVTPLPPPLVDIMDISAGVIVKERGIVRKGPAQYTRHTDEQIPVGALRPLGSAHVMQTMSTSDLLTRGSPIVRPLHSTEPIPPISSANKSTILTQ